MRQALAGMLWSQAVLLLRRRQVARGARRRSLQADRQPAPRNEHWHHMYNADIISMPDKWEYPWYAAWDLAFHVLPLTLVDPDFAKEQLDLMLRERYHASERPDSRLRVELRRRQPAGPRLGDDLHLSPGEGPDAARATWTGSSAASRSCCSTSPGGSTARTASGNNVFEGGFLGLDNIGVFDRSAPLPTGGYLEQADGTAWMALFCQNMLEIAVELALDEAGLRRHGAEVRRAFPLDRLGHDARRAATAACGTRRTASSTTCCGCPTAQPSG